MKGKEKWIDRLHDVEQKFLDEGNTEEWDVSLLCRVLLYSTLGLLVDEIPGVNVTKKDVLHMTQFPFGISDHKDIVGRKILAEITTSRQASCTAHECTEVSDNDVKIRPSLKKQKGVRIFLCSKPQWEEVDKLRLLRNDKFAHTSGAQLPDGVVTDLIDKVASSYRAVGVPQDIDDIEKIREIGMLNLPTHYRECYMVN